MQQMLELLLLGILSKVTEKQILRNTTVKTVGDKVEIIDEFYLNYFIDIDTDQQLTIERKHLSDDVKKSFTSEPMIVVANNLEKKYNCGHCSVEHCHDLIVYIPGLKRRYFASSDMFGIV